MNKVFRFDKIAEHFIFELAMLIIILLNIVSFIMENSLEQDDQDNNFETINIVLNYIYLAEALIKIVGLGIN